jgi:hypothetical protein
VYAAYGVSHGDSPAWSAAEWRRHLSDEELALLPTLRRLAEAIGDRDAVRAVDDLYVAHRLYESLLDAGRSLPAMNDPFSVDAHGEVEDVLVDRYRDALLRTAPRRAGGGVSTSGTPGGATLGAASGMDFDAMASSLDASAKKDAADREKRKAEANKKLDDWGRAVDSIAPGGGTALAQEAKIALAVIGTVVKWVQGDWDSDEQRARALDAARKALEAGVVPRSFDAEIDFAKTYADSTERETRRTEELSEPWQSVYDDYRASLLGNADSYRVASLVKGASGAHSEELGAEFLCGAIAQYEKRSNPGSPYLPAAKLHYGLADLVAAVASARFGTSLPDALRTAYAALPKVEASHPTVCSGRGYKGDPNTWEYDHGPVLYVLQAWLDLCPAPHRDALLARAPDSVRSVALADAADPWHGRMTAPSSWLSGAFGKLALLGGLAYGVWRVVW